MKRRWIYPQNGEPFEVSLDYCPITTNTDAALWNDRNYQDAGDPRFTSRGQHREYMRINGLTTVDDYKVEFKTREKERHDFQNRSASERRQDVANAIRKLENGR